MVFFKPYFIVLLIIMGALSSYTDIREKKIRNNHLLTIALFAAGGYIIFANSGNFNFLALAANFLIAALIALTLYHFNLWQAGDSKLFLTYSLLLPAAPGTTEGIFPCITLFVNTFLSAFLYVLPFYIYNGIRQRRMLTKRLFAKESVIYFGRILCISFGISWVAGPFLKLFLGENTIFLNIILVYFCYMLIRKLVAKMLFGYFFFIVIFTGIAIRAVLFPESFLSENIMVYLMQTISYALIIYLLNSVKLFGQHKQNEIPLAPFMFLGAFLTQLRLLDIAIKVFKSGWPEF
ncbi:MAG: hypothetical protein WC330_01040 [Candidatus Omnitrophota bacterium]|jgi:Flp pilus assembly protein protease CpaA